MLTSRTVKELSGHWQRQRESALKDSSGAPTTGLFTAEDLNVGIEGNGINDTLSFKIDTTPADGFTIAKSQKYDIRERPGAD